MKDRQLTPGQLLPGLLPFSCAARWWLALSGGMDSVVLLHLLVMARRENPDLPPITALHINHGLHEEAGHWQVFCQYYCHQLAVELHCEQVQVNPAGLGLEAAAREVRYRVFERKLGMGEVLFLAHHQDDQVETFFLRLLRGAGVDGLSAMPASRSLGEGHLCRPLLDYSRSTLQGYARRCELSHIEDPSNRNECFDRNYLRQQVLPLIEARWKTYRRSVSRAADDMRSAAEELHQLSPVIPRCRSRMDEPGLQLSALLALSDSLVLRQLRRWLAEFGEPLSPDKAALAEFLRQLRCGGDDTHPCLQYGAMILRRFRGGLYVCVPSAASTDLPTHLFRPGESVAVNGVGWLSLESASGAALQLNKDDLLSWRWRRGGETCYLPGRRGKRSLKKLLQEASVPPWWRERIPLLYLGDESTSQELLAVGDLWLCDSSRLVQKGEGWQVRWQRKTSSVCD
ncbi:MAG: tRNA lysidine(34) synthetase TilS [Parahaliea sp.]